MEGIDLAGVVDSDFQGIQINFAPPRPAGFANFRGAGQDLLFCGAGRGGAILYLIVYKRCSESVGCVVVVGGRRVMYTIENHLFHPPKGATSTHILPTNRHALTSPSPRAPVPHGWPPQGHVGVGLGG